MRSIAREQEELANELKDLMSEVVTITDSNIRSAIEKGWQPPADWQEKLSAARCGSDEDPDIWFTTLYEQYCADVAFPDGWTVLEKVALFGDLLLNKAKR